MSDLCCPFSAPIVKRTFACKYAQEVIRRGGSEIACQESAAHADCNQLYQHIKQAALASMEMQDDLLTLPHNVLLKIQYGGLTGLQQITDSDSQPGAKIDDINELVVSAQRRFDGLSSIPLEVISETIIDYKVQRRSKK